ncbi:MAG TPA: prepilin-type N-terminal cleavage/methylation domain-containing protein [Candidatus Acidoferrum sp.]|nr:prepilin-type N-terminal cleavage/methylation domain-containing protein [Candidatus Acidoferrum sp.]
MKLRTADCGVRTAERRAKSAAFSGNSAFGIQRKGAKAQRRKADALHAPRTRSRAFTLIELLAVIAIMGIIAAIALPSINSLKPNASAAASRQTLDAVTYARQLALSQRTTVYMVFVPPGFWNDPAYQSTHAAWSLNDQNLANTLIEKQLTGYCYVSLRSIGDQPGQSNPRYLTAWRTLPQGAYFSLEKFQQILPSVPVLRIYTNDTSLAPHLAYTVYPFNWTNNIPFPSETTKKSGAGTWVTLPYIAFNGMGQLVSGWGTPETEPEFIPITQGTVGISRDPHTKVALQVLPTPHDVPSGNTTNNYNVVFVDPLTGRGRIEHAKAL